MLSDGLKAILAVTGAIVTLAIIATLVSKKSNTANAITAVGGSLSKVIAAAVSPAATASTNGNLGLSSFSTSAGAGSGGGGFNSVLSQIMDTRTDLQDLGNIMNNMGVPQ